MFAVKSLPKKLATMMVFTFALIACRPEQPSIILETTMGTIELKLYDQTPQHRDNFLALVKEGAFDSLLFHRVIRDFMIQSGDPDSKYAGPGVLLGEGDRPYRVPAEFRLEEGIYHRRGVLAAARENDDTNPEQSSSAMQFYIVWGKIFDDAGLDKVQERLDRRTNGRVKLTPEMREVYKTVGGTPHLDGQYTVFGEVIHGLDVVDAIQHVATDENDRPLDDIRILRAYIGSPREKTAGGFKVELQNPVIPGFNPDPSVVAVGEDYYLVNSTFHYFPGVPVYHSRDLQNWKQIGNVLDRPSQLPLEQSNASLGIYAPTIRYNDGTFYMITTNVGGGGNFMVTATDPAGPWSEPVWLEQQGIDPSLYFEDGKCYMVSNPDNTITLCEIDPVTGATLSPGKALWKGTGGRYPEGPHIYKKDGWYYLLISEGGTELAHKLTVARSRNIYGPYEENPANPIFTHCSLLAQNSNIQGTGHGDFFQAADGSWWVVFLAYRRYGGDFHHLGRETFLAPVTWENGWPVINGGQPVAERMKVPMTAVPEKPLPINEHYDFSTVGPEWMHIQHPVPEHYHVSDGILTLTGGGDSFDWGGWHPTALLRRQQAAECRFGTQVTLQGDGEAGLVIYQTHNGHVEFFVRRTNGRPEAVVRIRLHSILHEQTVATLPKPQARLDVEAFGDHYTFFLDGKNFCSVDAKLLSTEMAGGFTGVTVGPYCRSGKATFNGFDYQEH